MKHKIHILPDETEIYGTPGERLLDILAANGIFLPAACAGKGTCGKCKVRLLEGNVKGTEADDSGNILSCHALLCEDITIALPQTDGSGLDRFDLKTYGGEKDGIGAILDIGTTTLAACLVDRKTGTLLAKHSTLNPQGICGADVLSRIQACAEGKRELLQSLILQKTAELLEHLNQNKVGEIQELVIAANTTMLHLFLGEDPATIGVYPFTPVFTATQRRSGKDLGLPVKEVRLLPSVGAYIGSDVTAGVLACEMQTNTNTTLLVDVGTNGEIVLSHKGLLYAASTAAGPALEGACIECGMGGIAGAIDKVTFQDGKLTFGTVQNAPARGICGSGLIDLIACLLEEGLIDETGAWDPDADSPLARFLSDDRFCLTENIYLSQKDIRQFQLAKSAISAGIDTLLAECDVTPEEVDALYLAGGLGFYMNIQNAARVGLLPPKMASKATAVGNTALAGARLCLLRDSAQAEIERIAETTRLVELSFSAVFQDRYMENMMFETKGDYHAEF